MITTAEIALILVSIFAAIYFYAACYFHAIIFRHYYQSKNHNRCWQNDLQLWRAARLITKNEFDTQYWPPPNEFRQECEKYLQNHHPCFRNNGELDVNKN